MRLLNDNEANMVATFARVIAAARHRRVSAMVRMNAPATSRRD
jgi:hypothetical protein